MTKRRESSSDFTTKLLPVLFHFSPEHADILLHKAFLVGIYGQIDTSSMISESMKVLHMEATT